MREAISKNLAQAYGNLAAPDYSFAAKRVEQGMYEPTVHRLSNEFSVDDQTSVGSDDVCVTLFVRPRGATAAWRWCVQLSLVGSYGIVSRVGEAQGAWPITEAHDASEAALLASLRDAGIELLPYEELREPTALRPPNTEEGEVYTLYNALFTDMTPMRSASSM